MLVTIGVYYYEKDGKVVIDKEQMRDELEDKIKELEKMSKEELENKRWF